VVDVSKNQLAMKHKTIYILHKNGAPSHYYGLAHLAKAKGFEVKYREFSLLSKFYKGIVKGNFVLVGKQLTNAGFLLGLLITSHKKIVLGIAPFDSKLGKLLPFLKNHQVYYHTSWTCWDKSFHPKTKKNTPKVFQTWKDFLEKKCIHIFSVTEKSKQSILENYSILEAKISVVYHSIHTAYERNIPQERIPSSLIYVGRLDKGKGIEELLTFASNNPEAIFTIVGDGKLEGLVKEYSKNFKNIRFEGYISDKNELKKLFGRHEFLVLNAKKTKTWEELFGLIIIEAMSQGTLPITTNHSGPKEIINPDFGFLFDEGEITTTLAKIVEENAFSDVKSENAIRASKKYTTAAISKKWRPILDQND
jgi:glycosyltransferase involved in cell wall biosynthesis